MGELGGDLENVQLIRFSGSFLVIALVNFFFDKWKHHEILKDPFSQKIKNYESSVLLLSCYCDNCIILYLVTGIPT